MLEDIYKMLGFDKLTVKINSLGDTESRNNYRDALVKYFAPHINDFCDDCKNRIAKSPLRILDCKVDQENEILKNAPTTINYLNQESKERFDKVLEYLDILQIEYEVDSKIVRGLDYYTHTVFEISVDVPELGGQNVIGAGGRYDLLCKELDGPSTPGIGFASGIDRLVLALEYLDKKVPIEEEIDLFFLYVSEDEKKYATYLTQELRLNGFSVETEYTGRSLKAQFKQSERVGAKYLVVLNDEQLNDGLITIKNTKTKEEDTILIDALIYYLDEKLSLEEDSCSCGEDHCCGEDECCCHDHEH